MGEAGRVFFSFIVFFWEAGGGGSFFKGWLCVCVCVFGVEVFFSFFPFFSLLFFGEVEGYFVTVEGRGRYLDSGLCEFEGHVSHKTRTFRKYTREGFSV